MKYQCRFMQPSPTEFALHCPFTSEECAALTWFAKASARIRLCLRLPCLRTMTVQLQIGHRQDFANGFGVVAIIVRLALIWAGGPKRSARSPPTPLSYVPWISTSS